MTTPRLFAFLLLASPLAAAAQTTRPSTTTTTTAPATPGMQQVTEVTEDLDPATGKVIRRTTRTTMVPIEAAPRPEATKGYANAPATTSTEPTATPVAPATDAVVSSFLKKKTAVAKLTTAELPTAYSRFMDQVRNDRQKWTATDWATAAAVLSSLNTRYEQLRPTLSLDDKVSIRSQQVEFQALRLGKQVTNQVTDKL